MANQIGYRTHHVPRLQLAAMVMFLMAIHMPGPAAARFKVWNPTTFTGRGAMESGPVVIELMQYHHVNSPFAQLNLTLAQRVEIAVKSSRERAEFFHSQIYGKQIGSKAVYESPVFSAQGSYLMQIKLGTPASTFVAIADTGSDLVWVQCTPDTIFQPTTSSSYKNLPCTSAFCTDLPSKSCSSAGACLYEYEYGDSSSTSGNLATETVALATTTGSTQSFPGVGFGCGHRQTGDFGGADGLVGLGQGPLSLVAQLGSQFGNVFSYCLVSYDSATSKTSELILGGSSSTPSGYTPIVSNPSNPTFYYVTLNGITVNGAAVSYPAGTFAIDGLGNGGFILDSGTTITQLPTAAYNPFRNKIASLISYPSVDDSNSGFDLCYDLSNVASPIFPSVVFQFQGVNVALPGGNVFLEVDNAGTYCFSFQGGDDGLSIFGNVQQQNFDITYDRANKRVGFKAQTC